MAPVWSRYFTVRPYLAGLNARFTLPFTTRIDHAIAMLATAFVTFAGVYVTGMYRWGLPPVVMLTILVVPTWVVRWWLRRPTPDGRDRIDQTSQLVAALWIEATVRWSQRTTLSSRRFRRTITLAGGGS